MVRQFGAQRTLEQRLLELLEQAVVAQQVLRLLVAGQKLVKMFWFDRHRVVPFLRLTTVPPHTIFLTLPGTAARQNNSGAAAPISSDPRSLSPPL
jgi:hypothetical protein